MTRKLLRIALLLATLLATGATLPAAEVTVSVPDSPLLRLASNKLEAALQRQGDRVKQAADSASDQAPGISVSVDPTTTMSIGPDGFQRTRVREGLKITASDERGAMYGLLDLAELGTKYNKLPVLSNSREPFSWAQLTPAVERDVEAAKAPLAPPNPTR